MTSSALPDGQAGPNPSANDRRVNMHLRVLFENACRITEPFFDPSRGWSTAHLTLYAQQVLRDTYPELSLQDIAILFSGVQSFHTASLNKQGNGV